jgi:hypothetical protein
MTRIIIISVIFIVIVCGSAVVGILIYKSTLDQPKSEHLLTVDKIEKMGKLELVKINIKDVVEQKKERAFYLPDAKAVLIIAGEVFAGIDLEKVKKEDIVDSGAKVSITLPKPEILMSKVDHQKSKVYNVEWGGFETATLVDEAYKNAELKIIEEAMATGYEQTCINNAKGLLMPIFTELSGKNVEILFKK